AVINVSGYTGVYDGTAHGATGSASANGENLTSLLNFGASFSDVPGGTAHWTFAGNANYAPASGDAAITITRRTVTVTADNKSKTYGDANPALTAGYSGFVNGDTETVLSGGPSLSTTAGAASPAGSYPIAVAAGTLSAANYSFSFINGTLTINNAVLTVTADDKTKVYGSTNPAFTSNYSGFVNGQTLATSGVTGNPALGTTAVASSHVGTYAITPAIGTLLSASYTCSFANSTCTITPKTASGTPNP